jgi:hypothetical protein
MRMGYAITLSVSSITNGFKVSFGEPTHRTTAVGWRHQKEASPLLGMKATAGQPRILHCGATMNTLTIVNLHPGQEKFKADDRMVFVNE